PGVASTTNVNYDYTTARAALSANDALQNLENLQYTPRPPVIVTNRTLGTNEFRYYLDANRNGRFEPTGLSFLTNFQGLQIVDQSNNPAVSYLTGDPQWIGALEFPD